MLDLKKALLKGDVCVGCGVPLILNNHRIGCPKYKMDKELERLKKQNKRR